MMSKQWRNRNVPFIKRICKWWNWVVLRRPCLQNFLIQLEALHVSSPPAVIPRRDVFPLFALLSNHPPREPQKSTNRRISKTRFTPQNKLPHTPFEPPIHLSQVLSRQSPQLLPLLALRSFQLGKILSHIDCRPVIHRHYHVRIK